MEVRTIALIGTHSNPLVSETIEHIYHVLSKVEGVEVIFEEKTAAALSINHLKLSEENVLIAYKLVKLSDLCDLAIIVGGDGNFLNAARNLTTHRTVPLIGVNRGKLGFLTSINPAEIEAKLTAILSGEYRSEKRFMLTAEVHSHNELSGSTNALNEILISSGQKTRLFEYSVEIDGVYAFSQRADGIIISTPTGSTGHALSAGGPILYPTLHAISLVPMFSHSLNSRPILISDDSVIKISIGDYNNPEPQLSFDGHSHLTLQADDEIVIKKHQKTLTILYPVEYDYFDSLRTKLHWSRLLFE